MNRSWKIYKDVTDKITDSDEYNLELETNLQRYKKLSQTNYTYMYRIFARSISRTRTVFDAMHDLSPGARFVMNTKLLPIYSTQTISLYRQS